jgi:hypothetical protein
MRAVLFGLSVGVALSQAALAHSGGLNACGCHFDRATGECHCHLGFACGCECEPAECVNIQPVQPGGVTEVPTSPEPAAAVPTNPTQPAAPELQTAAEFEPEALAGGCGVERWNVKTLSEPTAKGLHRQRPSTATVERLTAMTPPPWSAKAPRRAAERHAYSVDGCVVAYALEGDSDLHVVVQGESGATIIVEFPDPASCAPWSHAPGLIQRAREDLLRLVPERPTSSFKYVQPGISVTVVGLLFFDKVHGQAGVAPNGVEIHPVLRVKHRAGNCR